LWCRPDPGLQPCWSWTELELEFGSRRRTVAVAVPAPPSACTRAASSFSSTLPAPPTYLTFLPTYHHRPYLTSPPTSPPPRQVFSQQQPTSATIAKSASRQNHRSRARGPNSRYSNFPRPSFASHAESLPPGPALACPAPRLASKLLARLCKKSIQHPPAHTRYRGPVCPSTRICFAEQTPTPTSDTNTTGDHPPTPPAVL
jgi:hypothetical protein